MPRSHLLLAVALTVLAGANGSSTAFPATGRTVEILPPDGEGSLHFGRSLAQQRRWLAVGSPRDGERGRIAGAVHVYRKQGREWVHEARLVGSEAAEGHRFGTTLTLHRRRLIVGSPRAERSVGRVHVFVRSGGGWTEEARILPPEPWRGRFGVSVAAQGPRIVIGAPHYRVGPRHRGAALVYRRARGAWQLEQILESPPLVFGFGQAVAIRPGLIAVGMDGRVALYERRQGHWTPVQTLEASHAGAPAVFGGAISLPPPGVFAADGQEIVVGAPREIDFLNGQGATYVFRKVGERWEQTHRLHSPAPDHGANFGLAVVSGARGLVIGETYDFAFPASPGEAWFFPRDGEDFGPGRPLVESSLEQRLAIGQSVAISPAGITVGEGQGRTVRAVPWGRSDR